MDTRLRESRLRQLLEEMPRRMLYALARGVEADVDGQTKSAELIESIIDVRWPVLKRGLATGVNVTDLRRLCDRVGYSSHGGPNQLAGRLITAIETPLARITRWLPFAKAREYAQRLNLNSQKEWFELVRGAGKKRLPDGIPASPWLVYRDNGWTSWGDFLGTNNPARHLVEYRAFAKARAYARSLGLSNAVEWQKLCRKKVGNKRVMPADIPAAPWRVYDDKGWVSFGDWLGTNHVHASKIKYRSYRDARAFVRELGIRSEPEWVAYCRGENHRSRPRPLDIPSNPQRTYKDKGWVSWGEFLGTGSVANASRKFRSYAAARAFARSRHLRSARDWRDWCAESKRPLDIPGSPDHVYKDKGWKSWADFLGTDNVHPTRVKWKTIREAKEIARNLRITSRAEFLRAKQNGKLPREVPVTIDRRPDWTGWSSFLPKKQSGKQQRAN